MKMMTVAGVVVGAMILAGMASAGGKLQDEEREKAIATFALKPTELPIMKTCEDTLLPENIEFKSKVSRISACGCMAREISDGIEPGEVEFAAAALPMLIVASVKDKKVDKAMADVDALSKQHQLSENQTGTVLASLLHSVKTCSAPSVYISPEDKAKIAGEAKAKAEKTRATLERAVHNGDMTRQEADRIRSRLQ